MKACGKCKARKSKSAFAKDKGRRLGLQSTCRECQAQDKYKSRYGITPAEYEERLEYQEGVCQICRLPPSGGRLNVDHCHDTNNLRGLLCGNCNRALGLFKEDEANVLSAVEYLKSPIWRSIDGSIE
jgi:hypothetical protein